MSLRAEAVSVRLGRRTVLDTVSLTLEPGRVTAVVGPNGAGKSTLLAVLSGERVPDAGRVLLDERPLGAWSLEALARRRAVLPQTPSLSFPFRVAEVVDLGRLPHARTATREENTRMTACALERVGLAGLEARPYTALSGGEQQRVQLARALAQLGAPQGEPRYLLLDEPTSALDLAHVQRLGALLRELAAEDVASFLVVHDLNLAARLADQVLLLAGGRAVACGTPAEVLTADPIREAWGVEVALVDHPDGGQLIVVRDVPGPG